MSEQPSKPKPPSRPAAKTPAPKGRPKAKPKAKAAPVPWLYVALAAVVVVGGVAYVMANRAEPNAEGEASVPATRERLRSVRGEAAGNTPMSDEERARLAEEAKGVARDKVNAKVREAEAAADEASGRTVSSERAPAHFDLDSNGAFDGRDWRAMNDTQKREVVTEALLASQYSDPSSIDAAAQARVAEEAAAAVPRVEAYYASDSNLGGTLMTAMRSRD